MIVTLPHLLHEERGNSIVDMKCDLLTKNGTLLDPGTGMNQKADIATKGCEIAFVGKSGDKMGFESAQIPGEDPVLFESSPEPLKEGQRGRGVKSKRVTVPYLADLVSEDLADYIRRSKILRGIPPAHEFIRSIIEERQASMDAMRGGEAIMIPGFD